VDGTLETIQLADDGTLALTIADPDDASQVIAARLGGGSTNPDCTLRSALFTEIGLDPTTLPAQPGEIWASDPDSPPTGVTAIGNAAYDSTAWTLESIIRLLVTPPGASGGPGSPSGPPAGATHAAQFVALRGADPAVVAERIAGPDAYWQRAPAPGMDPPPDQLERSERTFVVALPPGTEGQALLRAEGDPDVETARLVSWPPIIPV
jgi:hypothetical protein